MLVISGLSSHHLVTDYLTPPMDMAHTARQPMEVFKSRDTDSYMLYQVINRMSLDVWSNLIS